MNSFRPLLVILAFCLALVAPAQAGGLLGGRSDACRHIGLGATLATAGVHSGQDGIVAAPCHVVCAIVEAAGTLDPDVLDGDHFIAEPRPALSLRPAGIERPPKASASIA